MLAAMPSPSTTEAAAVAEVLADIDDMSCGKQEFSASRNDPKNSLLMNIADDWRDQAYDRPLRRQIIMQIFKLFDKSNQNQHSAQWRRKLPALVRLIEAAHYRASPTREAYLGADLKKRVKALAIAFHQEMRKQGDRTFNVPRQMVDMVRLPRAPLVPTLSEEPVLVANSARQA